MYLCSDMHTYDRKHVLPITHLMWFLFSTSSREREKEEEIIYASFGQFKINNYYLFIPLTMHCILLKHLLCTTNGEKEHTHTLQQIVIVLSWMHSLSLLSAICTEIDIAQRKLNDGKFVLLFAHRSARLHTMMIKVLYAFERKRKKRFMERVKRKKRQISRCKSNEWKSYKAILKVTAVL